MQRDRFGDELLDLVAGAASRHAARKIGHIRTPGRRLPPNWVAEQAAQGDSDIADLVIKTPSDQGQALFLVEVETGVSPRDVEALIDGTLADEGLIDRERSGPVNRVDWPALLRRRSKALDLFRPAGTYRYVARQGASALLDRLRSRTPSGTRLPTVTGSFAAARLAPFAAPTLLVLYTPNPLDLGSELELLPAEAGADTVLIRPDNEVAFARSERNGGVAWAAPSQVAIDCLAGTVRMPSEGDALIAWMQDNEDRWRHPTIQGLLADELRTGGLSS